MNPTRAALASLIDYAGLFPPASRDLPSVLADHRRYLRSPDRWLLGRLIVPRARLDDLASLIAGESPSDGEALPWTISVLAGAEAPLEPLGDEVGRLNPRLRRHGAAIVAIEVAVRTAGEIDRVARLVPDRYERYVELPLDEGLPRLVRAAAAGGCYAKVRSGGITAEAFPAPAALARFMALCAGHEVPFKATAGLHHPFRGSYPLTYEPQSVRATMHGFVPLVMAAALLYTRRIDEDAAAEILASREPFRIEEDGLRWGSHVVSGLDLSFSRAHLFRSVGSCSFEDALGDLRGAGWI